MKNIPHTKCGNARFVNVKLHCKKVHAEEKNYGLWKDFLSNFKNEFDHLNFKDWPQEGP